MTSTIGRGLAAEEALFIAAQNVLARAGKGGGEGRRSLLDLKALPLAGDSTARGPF